MLAQHKATKHWVAIKVLRKDKVVKMKQVEHAKYEKQILDEVKCPFVVNLLAFFQDAKNLYLVLEYVRGGEMFTHLRKAGRFTDEVAKFYAAEVVLAWEYIHSRNIIYRDLKPENLLINADGHLKAWAAGQPRTASTRSRTLTGPRGHRALLRANVTQVTDFGFAKRVEDRTWTVCGTPEYLAPEIILSRGCVRRGPLGHPRTQHPSRSADAGAGVGGRAGGRGPAAGTARPSTIGPWASSSTRCSWATRHSLTTTPTRSTKRSSPARCAAARCVFAVRRTRHLTLPLVLASTCFLIQVRYPSHLKPSAKDLIANLLQTDITKRYGNLKNGIDDIKNHKWFAGIDWEALKQLKVDPPFVPKVTGGEGDDSNFGSYEEDPDLVPAPGAVDPFEDKFKDW